MIIWIRNTYKTHYEIVISKTATTSTVVYVTKQLDTEHVYAEVSAHKQYI